MNRLMGFVLLGAGVAGAAVGLTSNAGGETADFGALEGAADLSQTSLTMNCYAPDTASEYILKTEMNMGRMNGPGAQRFELGGRWPGTAGTAVELTYSFPPDGLFISSTALNNEMFSRMNALFSGSPDPEATWKALFRASFDVWEEVTGNTYTEVSDDGAGWGSAGQPGQRGDIRIAMTNIDGPNNTLAFNSFPSSGGDMVMDRSENWASSTGGNRFMRNVVMHEHGHGLGMFHSCPTSGQPGGNSRLMQPSISLSFDGPQHDDIRGAQFHYGDKFEPNGITSVATDLNALGLSSGSDLNLQNTLSLRNSSDQDVFELTVNAGAQLSVTATPTGLLYLTGPQNGTPGQPSGCSLGTAEDSRIQQDLRIEILNGSGNVISTTDANGLGDNEVLTDFNLGSAGTFYVRINSAQSNGTIQLYNAFFSLGGGGLVGDLNGDGCIGATDLAIMLGAWGPNAGQEDLDGDGFVGSSDLAIILGSWGQGPGC